MACRGGDRIDPSKIPNNLFPLRGREALGWHVLSVGLAACFATARGITAPCLGGCGLAEIF